jgi:hypothetical protein
MKTTNSSGMARHLVAAQTQCEEMEVLAHGQPPDWPHWREPRREPRFSCELPQSEFLNAGSPLCFSMDIPEPGGSGALLCPSRLRATVVSRERKSCAMSQNLVLLRLPSPSHPAPPPAPHPSVTVSCLLVYGICCFVRITWGRYCFQLWVMTLQQDAIWFIKVAPSSEIYLYSQVEFVHLTNSLAIVLCSQSLLTITSL